MVPLIIIASALSFVAPPCRPMGTLVAAHRPNALVSSPVAVIDVVEPSYNLALGSLALGALFGVPGSPLKSKVCGPLLCACDVMASRMPARARCMCVIILPIYVCSCAVPISSAALVAL